MAGIDNGPGSIGYEHMRAAPPAALVHLSATQACCQKGCSATNSTSSPPLPWASAVRRTIKGEFSLFWRTSCPSQKPTLAVDVAVAPNSLGTTVIPILADVKNAVVTEGGTSIWKDGAFIPGVKGITNAAIVGGAIEVQHGSGNYNFVISG